MNARMDNVLSHLKNPKLRPNGSYQAHCPAHDDRKASLSITPASDGTILLYCHAGCDTKDVLDSVGMDMGDLYPPRDNYNGKKSNIIETYEYFDENGVLLYQVCRLKDKQFRQRRPEGSDGWAWNISGVKPVLYRLPSVLEAVDKGQSIYIVEGEKDVHTLESWGFVVTTNSGGAMNWKHTFSAWLHYARVIIIPDNDDRGRSHAEDIATKLHGSAADIIILDLPDLQPKHDITDWINNGGTKDQLIELVSKTPFWKPSDKPELEPEDKKNGRSLKPSYDSNKFSPTDTWNADFLASNFGDQIRYNHSSKKWHIWDGTRWQLDNSKQIIQLAKKNAVEILKLVVSMSPPIQRGQLT